MGARYRWGTALVVAVALATGGGGALYLLKEWEKDSGEAHDALGADASADASVARGKGKAGKKGARGGKPRGGGGRIGTRGRGGHGGIGGNAGVGGTPLLRRAGGEARRVPTRVRWRRPRLPAERSVPVAHGRR